MASPFPLILICGDSVLLVGLEASLRGAAGVQTLHLPAATTPDAVHLPAGGVVVIFDQAERDLGQLAPWLTACPGLTLLGLDAEHDRIHVVTGHSQAVGAVGDLARVVLEAACSVDKETGKQGGAHGRMSDLRTTDVLIEENDDGDLRISKRREEDHE